MTRDDAATPRNPTIGKDIEKDIKTKGQYHRSYVINSKQDSCLDSKTGWTVGASEVMK